MPRLDISKLRRNRAIYLKLGLLLSLVFVSYAFTLEIDHIDYSSKVIIEDIDSDAVMIPPTVHPERPPVPPPPPELQKIDPEVLEDSPEFIEEPIPLEIPVDVPENQTTEKFENLAVVAPPIIPKPALPEDKVIPDIDVEDFVDFADEMPRFPGCEEEGLTREEKKMCSDKALIAFIYKHARYPKLAKEVGMEGTVYVEFIIDKKGEPGKFKIVRSPGKLLSDEAIRVLKKMPNWKPGKQRLRPVNVRYRLPLKFHYEG